VELGGRNRRVAYRQRAFDEFGGLFHAPDGRYLTLQAFRLRTIPVIGQNFTDCRAQALGRQLSDRNCFPGACPSDPGTDAGLVHRDRDGNHGHTAAQ